jgi:hypothetical protein
MINVNCHGDTIFNWKTHLFQYSIVVTCKQFSTPTAHTILRRSHARLKNTLAGALRMYNIYYVQQRRILLEQKLLSDFRRAKKKTI